MEAEFNELKSVLRSLVVSSPTQVNVRSLMRDYRTMMGTPLPLAKYGYRDPILFLKERFCDCFLLQGSSVNPVLTLIVPDSLKHIDNFVQKQKVAPTQKFKEKRTSIPAAVLTLPKNFVHETLILNKNPPCLFPKSKTKNVLQPIPGISEHPPENKHNYVKSGEVTSVVDPKQTYNGTSRVALEHFMKKRIPLHFNNEQYNDNKYSSKDDVDSGRQTASSTNSSKWIRLEELKVEIRSLIEDHPQRGIWCTDLIEMYRKHYGRELNIARLGYTSVLSLACELEGTLRVWRPPGASDWQLQSPHVSPPTPPAVGDAHTQHIQHPARTRHCVDPDDALPGVDFDADVFPADCMHYMESIPLPDLTGLRVGATIEVIVGEVYSPSHLWLIRLGQCYHIAMEDVMDEMTEYYERGAGRERWLSRGAVRVGQYCSSCYEGDWHRSLIVKLVDSDTVKVRHVDYGTVERCAVSRLRPLLRRWAALPQQALRARLAALRPPASGRRWPHAAAAHLLRLVTQRRFVAVLVALEDDVLEVMLVDTSTEEDVCINSEMIRSGHADSRHDSCLGVSEKATPSSGGPSPTGSEAGDALDMRSVLTFTAQSERCDSDSFSEISVSASEVWGPRRLASWACDEVTPNAGPARLAAPCARRESAPRARSGYLERVLALHDRIKHKYQTSGLAAGKQTKTGMVSEVSGVSPQSRVLHRRLQLTGALCTRA